MKKILGLTSIFLISSTFAYADSKPLMISIANHKAPVTVTLVNEETHQKERYQTFDDGKLIIQNPKEFDYALVNQQKIKINLEEENIIHLPKSDKNDNEKIQENNKEQDIEVISDTQESISKEDDTHSHELSAQVLTSDFQILSNQEIQLKDHDKVIETKSTDKEGYVTFDVSNETTYSLTIEDTNEILSIQPDEKRYFILKESAETENKIETNDNISEETPSNEETNEDEAIHAPTPVKTNHIKLQNHESKKNKPNLFIQDDAPVLPTKSENEHQKEKDKQVDTKKKVSKDEQNVQKKKKEVKDTIAKKISETTHQTVKQTEKQIPVEKPTTSPIKSFDPDDAVSEPDTKSNQSESNSTETALPTTGEAVKSLIKIAGLMAFASGLLLLFVTRRKNRNMD